MSREEWLSKTHSDDRSPAVKYTVFKVEKQSS
jgi:hypothetical protein